MPVIPIKVNIFLLCTQERETPESNGKIDWLLRKMQHGWMWYKKGNLWNLLLEYFIDAVNCIFSDFVNCISINYSIFDQCSKDGCDTRRVFCGICCWSGKKSRISGARTSIFLAKVFYRNLEQLFFEIWFQMKKWKLRPTKHWSCHSHYQHILSSSIVQGFI